MTNEGGKIIAQLLSGEISPSPEITNDLLDEFWNGLPIKNLKLLLQSGILELELSAVYILSELGPEIDESLTELAIKCLSHPNWDVRYHGLRYFYYNGLIPDERALEICKLLYDEHGLVRLLALRLTSDMNVNLYKSVSVSIEAANRYSDLKDGLVFLLSNDASDESNIIDHLQSEERMERYFGAIAAAKMYPNNIKLIKIAAKSDDIEVADFSSKILEENLLSTSEH